MTPDQARQLISEAAARVAPDADLDGLAPDADLRDGLELDSLDFLRLVEILSERTGKQITEDDYPQLATLASAIKFIAGGLSQPAVVLLGLAVLVVAKIGNHYLRQIPGAWAATLVALGVGAAWQGKVRSWPTAGVPSVVRIRALGPYRDRLTAAEAGWHEVIRSATARSPVMKAQVGDELVVRGRHVGDPDRTGAIIEVIGEAGGPPYLVRWSDGHESSFFPTSGTAVEHTFLPARKHLRTL